jgi:hypothetical protein
VEADERAVVESGVEPIANTNRIVPAVVGEARDKRKRVTLPTRRRSRRTSRCRLSPSFGVDVGSLAVQHSEPVVQQHDRLRLGVTPAHRQLRPRTPHNRIDIVVQQYASALTLVNNGDQQHAEHTSLAKLRFTVSYRGSA